ncbi:hypothetical protein ES332_D06G176300v1 [Gossypium tomentosum]|uniref:Uncharacterized protein n=1 Tax=Gossypium tomentosum TaxID=34277 RepID=A0A5D2KJF7_GOSTO|nr:hypothetical protein ES332_D06G176300v1 [Gossypium tomentosum]
MNRNSDNAYNGTAYGDRCGGTEVAVRRRAWLGRTALEAARVSASDFALGRFVIGLGSRQIGFKF